MKKILLVSDSPYATTGLGRMSKSFLKMLPEFEWTIWGFLHPNFDVRHGRWYPAYNENDFGAKFKLFSPKSYTDNQFGLEYIPELIIEEKPDFLITSLDFDKASGLVEKITELKFLQDFKWINYFPMDREDYKAIELDLLRFPDINVCITKYGVNKIKAINPRVKIHQIYHPIDESEFPQIKKKDIEEFRVKSFEGVNKDTFLAGTINRSFARKDTARLVVAASKFLNDVKDAYFYIHGSMRTFEGLDLGRLAFENGVPNKRMSFLPGNISEVDGVGHEQLNKIYRSLNLFVTLSGGEGFGFSTVEALLTETPIIAPSNTCFPELIQDFGYIIPTKDFAFHYNNTTSMWPIVNVDEVVEKMKYVKDNYSEAKLKAKAGAKWVRENLNLKVIGDQWREILK